MNFQLNIKSQVLLLLVFISTLFFKVASSQNTNTTCATAINVVTNGACAPAVTVTDATIDGNANVCGVPTLREAWYTFIATGTTATIVATANNRNVAIELLSACGGTVIGCDNTTTANGTDTETLTASGLTNGITYVVRIVNVGTNDLNFTSLCITGPVSAPSNDDPSGATPISTSASCSYSTFTNANATSSTCGTIPAPGCSSYTGGDVWFSVTVPASGSISFDSQTGVILDGGMAVYSGTPCGILSLIGCDDDSSPNGAMPMLTVNGQTPGATLYVRFWEYGNDNNGTFGLCATAVVAPANDDCGGAISLTVNSGTACTTSTGGTLLGATASTETNTCVGGTADDDVWYKFTATASTHSVSITNIAGSVTNLYHSVYGGTCGSIGSPLVCSDPNSSVISGLSIGNIYYIRIFSNTATGGQNTTFSVCVTTPPPPPANDNCSGATAFPVVPTDGSCSNLNNQSTANGTDSGVTPSGACTSNSGTPDDDVWFSFNATGTTMNLAATNVSGSTDVYWQVYSGACGASMTSILCTDNNAGGIISGLTIGQIYFIKLYTYSSSVSTVQNICLSVLPDPCTTTTNIATCGSTVNATFASGTGIYGTSSCGFSTGGKELIYTFTPSSTGTYSIQQLSSFAYIDYQFKAFSAGCSSTGWTCIDDLTGAVTSPGFALTGGTQYYILLDPESTAGGNVSFIISCPPPIPTNDECAGALSVTANTNSLCASTTTGTSNGATQTLAGCTGNADDDVWFMFTANATTHSITVTPGTINNVVFEVFTGTCAGMTTYSCVNNTTGITAETSIIAGLSIGTNYFVRVYSNGNNTNVGTFSVCVNLPPPPPANDNCPGATILTVNSGSTCTSSSGGTLLGATTSTIANTCTGGTADDDVWYQFTATATSHSVSITNVAGSVTDMYHSIYGGTCGSIGAPLTCNDANLNTVTGLTIGNVYYVRVYSYTSAGGQNTTFSVCVLTPPPPPANDECAGAVNVTVNGGTTCTSQSNGTLIGATASSYTNACGGTADDDVWYKFTAANTTHSISITNISGATDMYHSLYAGTCAAIGAPLICSDPNGSSISGLTVGSVYYIRVFSYTSTGGQTTTFSVCVTTPTVTTPTNDNCSGATTVAVNSGTTCTTQAGGTLVNAFMSTVPNDCFGTADDDVWYKFVATATTHSISINNIASTPSDLYHSVYTGTCGTLGSALICSDPNTSIVTGLSIGSTYFIRVFSYTSGTGSTTTFSVCVSTPTTAPPPTNDECSGAYTVAVNSGTTCTSLTDGTLIGATASTQTNSCGSTIDDDDVWYSFVATAAYHQITLNNVAGSTTDLYHSVFAGTCGSIGAALTCNDPNSSAVNNLTIGNTYYIRIYSAGSTWGVTTTFSVCITTPPPPPANTSCSGMEPICSGSAINFTAESNGASAAPGPNYGCLSTRPNPTWFFMEILTAGTMAIDITATSDIDFALWGPYANLAAAKASCSSYPTPLDCSYSSSAIEQANIASVTVGQVYALLVTNYANTVQNITLDQAAGASATTNCAIILPVGLLYFNAVPDDNVVNIRWETASELNNDYFEVERSIDGVKWEVLNRKKGMGTIQTKTNYNTIDEKPFFGMSYYRLKQVDFNEVFIYSNIVSVDLSKGKEQVTNVHPNPTNSNIEFDVISKTKNQILIELIDNTGSIVSTQQNIIDEGSNSIKLNLEKFDSGIYLLKVSFVSSGKSVIQKVIKH